MSTNGQGKWRGKMCAMECLRYLCLSEKLADVWFTFNGDSDVRLPSHKFVLQMRSEVFEEMFSAANQVPDKTNEICIEDVNREVMELILRFLYTDEINLDHDNIFSVLHAANKFMLEGLHDQCVKFLVQILDADNVCDIYEKVQGYDLDSFVSSTCLEYIRRHAWKVFKTERFLNITSETLSTILDSDLLTEKEIEIFRGVRKWAEHQCVLDNKQSTVKKIKSFIEDTLYKVRFPLMTSEEFTEEVQPSGLLSDEDCLLLHQYISQKEDRTDAYEGKFIASPRNGGVLTEQIFNSYPDPTRVPGGCEQTHVMTITTNLDIHLYSLKGPLTRYIAAVRIRKQHHCDVSYLIYDHRKLLLEADDNWTSAPYKYCAENEEIIFRNDILLLPIDNTYIRIELSRRLLDVEGHQNDAGIAFRPRKRARAGRRQGAEEIAPVVRATNMSLIIQKTNVSLQYIPPGINQMSFR